MRSAALVPFVVVALVVIGCGDEIPAAPSERLSQSAADTTTLTTDDSPEPSTEGVPLEGRDEKRTTIVDQTLVTSTDAVGSTPKQAEPAPQTLPDTDLMRRTFETAVQTVVPNRAPSVRLYALPNSDWPVVALRHPSQSITIVALAPLLPGDTESGWLLAETPDGMHGWVTAQSLQAQVEDLAHLPRLDRADAVAHATTREGAVIRWSPHGDDHCVLPVGNELEVAARSPDGQWFYVRPEEQPCVDSRGREIWRGWILASNLEYEPLLDRAPVIHSYGMWMVPTDPGLQPERIPIQVRDNWESESWGFDPDDQSIVFVSSDESGNPVLKRYTTETTVVAKLPHGSGDILVAPTGGRVLVMAGSHNEASSFGIEPRYTLTIVEPDGRTTDIGEAFLYCQCGRGRFLSAQARWLPDGQAVVFRDWGIPEQAAPDHNAGEFWLYHVDSGERVELLARRAQRLPIYDTAVFHPDGQSLYVRVVPPGYTGDYTLRRITLDGEDWPGFRPVPIDGSVRVSPDGQWLIARTNGVLLTLTDQGELRSARAGVNPQWLPDSSHFAYEVDGQRMLGNIRLDRGWVIPVPGYPAWWRPILSPDGAHIAVDSHWDEWPYHWWVDTSVIRIYNVEGHLRTTFRYTGCSHWHWSPDGSRLAVSARSDCSAP